LNERLKQFRLICAVFAVCLRESAAVVEVLWNAIINLQTLSPLTIIFAANADRLKNMTKDTLTLSTE